MSELGLEGVRQSVLGNFACLLFATFLAADIQGQSQLLRPNPLYEPNPWRIWSPLLRSLLLARNGSSERNELQCSAKHIFCISWLICQRLAGIQGSMRTRINTHPCLRVKWNRPPLGCRLVALAFGNGWKGSLASRPTLIVHNAIGYSVIHETLDDVSRHFNVPPGRREWGV